MIIYTVIGLSETHFKEKPHGYYNLPGYKIEFVNIVGPTKRLVYAYALLTTK